MAENREELLNRARMLYLTGRDPSGLRFLLKNRLGFSDVEISQAYTGWNLEQQQVAYRKEAEARLAGATPLTGAAIQPPREPRKISNLFGLMRRRGVPQSDLQRIAQEVEIARFGGGRIASASVARVRQGATAEVVGKGAAATGHFLQRTPGYARTGIDTGFERAGAVTSKAFQKTPGLGGMLFGNVPRRPAPTMKNMPPAVRSAANAARIVLQKRSEGIWKEFKGKQDDLKRVADTTGTELKKLTDTMHSINQKINEEMIKLHAPGEQQNPSNNSGE